MTGEHYYNKSSFERSCDARDSHSTPQDIGQQPYEGELPVFYDARTYMQADIPPMPLTDGHTALGKAASYLEMDLQFPPDLDFSYNTSSVACMGELTMSPPEWPLAQQNLPGDITHRHDLS
jgi:hypothetical protein